MIAKRFGSIYVIKFLKFLKFHLSFLVLTCIGNMCPFAEKKKKKKALYLVQHISSKRLPTLFFQPRPNLLLFQPVYYSGIESKYKQTHLEKLQM